MNDAPEVAMTTTTILLADDHQMVRTCLRSLIESEEGIKVIGEAGDGRTAVRLARELAPDVVLMDLRMPDLNGIEATRLIARADPPARVIVLSAYADEQTTKAVLDAGASGFLVKDAAFNELAKAIGSVANGKVYLSPQVAEMVVESAVGSRRPSAFTTLTSREREVLQLIAEGKATKEVAAELGVSLKTAETHRRAIMEKLDLRSVAELTKYAIREGLTSLDVR